MGDGVPALVLALIPGKAVGVPDLGRLPRLAATIHAVDSGRFAHRNAAWFGTVPIRHPTNATEARLRERAAEVAAAGSPPWWPELIHRSLHPGNVLWLRGRCSGVVDWINVCAGPAGCDIALLPRQPRAFRLPRSGGTIPARLSGRDRRHPPSPLGSRPRSSTDRPPR